MRLIAPLAVLALVTALESAYGRFGWSFLAGPVAAAVVYGLDRSAHTPGAPAPAHQPEPAPVD